jgi:hypothetical protein
MVVASSMRLSTTASAVGSAQSTLRTSAFASTPTTQSPFLAALIAAAGSASRGPMHRIRSDSESEKLSVTPATSTQSREESSRRSRTRSDAVAQSAVV